MRSIRTTIVSAEAGVTRYTFDKLCYLVPQTGLEAKFSMPYTIARALLDRSIGFDTFTDRLVQDERAQALTRRISMYVHDGIESAWKMGSRPVNVRLRLRDGRVLERQVDISKGNPEVAMTAQELEREIRGLRPPEPRAAGHQGGGAGPAEYRDAQVHRRAHAALLGERKRAAAA